MTKLSSEYKQALLIICNRKKAEKSELLKGLDAFYHSLVPGTSRTKEDVILIMYFIDHLINREWKITRGKFRPLMKFVRNLDKFLLDSVMDDILELLKGEI
jgi:hypothetical protein